MLEEAFAYHDGHEKQKAKLGERQKKTSVMTSSIPELVSNTSILRNGHKPFLERLSAQSNCAMHLF
ncbi:MAG: hypothetical protein ABI378_16165 [Chitinophagaceae bacterium]